MKILYAFNQDLNPYVEVLQAGLQAAGCPIETGTDRVWDEEQFDYDIVHIQWPETLFDWRVPSRIELLFLKQRLKQIHSRSRIVFTRHNAVSHHSNPQNAGIMTQLYDLCAAECDVMIHLGEATRRAALADPALCGKRHEMIPIPVYDELCAPHMGMDAADARRRLGIPPDQKVVLAFGNFRFEKERELVAGACRGLKNQGACLVAPKWHKPREYSFDLRHVMLSVRTLRKAVGAWSKGMKLRAKPRMTEEEVALYFTAADVVFLQRIDELNSGNLPMAFLFKNVVVGPDCHNIGDWCRVTGNPVFDAENINDARRALRRALELSDTDLGEKNHRFGMTHWSTRKLGREHAELYRKIYEGR